MITFVLKLLHCRDYAWLSNDFQLCDLMLFIEIELTQEIIFVPLIQAI